MKPSVEKGLASHSSIKSHIYPFKNLDKPEERNFKEKENGMKNIPNHCSNVHREQTKQHKIKDQEGQQLNIKLLNCEILIENN